MTGSPSPAAGAKIRRPLGGLLPLLPFVAVGLVGALVFRLLGLPAPYLSGAMMSVAVAVLVTGRDAAFPSPIAFALYTVMGLAMGGGVTPDVVERIYTWPISLALLIVSFFAITGAVFAYLALQARWDRPTAFFASIPGALTYVLAVTQGMRVDGSRVAQSQSVRVVLLIAVLPSIVVVFGGAGALPPPALAANPLDLAILFAGGTLGATIAARCGVPAGALVGSFVASALLHGFGLVEGRPPQIMIDVGFVLLGTLIGLRFRGTTLGELKVIFGTSLVASTLSLGIAAALAFLAAYVLAVPFGQTLLAFAPGGLEAMVMLAFMLDLDPAFVAIHQLFRFFGMILFVPFTARLLLGSDWRAPTVVAVEDDQPLP